MIPYATFSFFHAMDYFRSFVIPTFFPSSSTVPQNPITKQVSNVLQQIVVNYHEPAMSAVSYIEVMGIMPRLILGVLTFQNHIFAVFIYANFLSLRFVMSRHIQEAMQEATARLDHLLLPPSADSRIPPAVSRAYMTVKQLVIKYGKRTFSPETMVGIRPATGRR